MDDYLTYELDEENPRGGVFALAEQAASTAWRCYGRDLSTRLYLWHRPSDKAIPGQVCVSHCLPGVGFELSHNEHIPRNFTVEEMQRLFFVPILRRLPILPTKGR